jgi:hypothetical protein
MPTQDVLIKKILSASGITGRRARREVSRELASHLEEIVAEARDAGHDDPAIERIVRMRFGNPDEIALQFAGVYWPERVAARIAEFSLLAAVSLGIILAFAAGVQMIAALWFGLSPAGVFSQGHLRTEVGFFAPLTLGYLALRYSPRIFSSSGPLKSSLFAAASFALVCAGLEFWLPPQGLIATLGFVCAALVRVVEVFSSRRLIRLAAVAAVLSLAWVLAAPCLNSSGHPSTPIVIVPVGMAIAASCHFLIWLARLFDRRFLRRELI